MLYESPLRVGTKEYNDNFAHEYETALNTQFYMQTLTLECKSVQTLIMLHFVSPFCFAVFLV